MSDRWLPVSPVTGAVDAFEWKAPVDAIGRGDDKRLIEELAPPRDASAMAPATAEQPAVVDVTPTAREETPVEEEPAPEKPAEEKAPEKSAEPASAPTLEQSVEKKPAPSVFMPTRPPDDPGVAQAEADESPTSLERLRAAHIR